MTRQDTNTIKYVIALISEFASTYKLNERQAYNYLAKYKGMKHLSQFYDVLHTQSFEDTVETLAEVCHNNGGELR